MLDRRDDFNLARGGGRRAGPRADLGGFLQSGPAGGGGVQRTRCEGRIGKTPSALESAANDRNCCGGSGRVIRRRALDPSCHGFPSSHTPSVAAVDARRRILTQLGSSVGG